MRMAGTREVLRTRESGGDEREDESRIHFEMLVFKRKQKVKTVIILSIKAFVMNVFSAVGDLDGN